MLVSNTHRWDSPCVSLAERADQRNTRGFRDADLSDRRVPD
jgi:hypothetical protein